MDAAFGWIGEIFDFFVSLLPTFQPVERRERALKYSGARVRKIEHLDEERVYWYWPLFTEIEVFNMAWQPLTTTAINVMDEDQRPVTARGFAVWRIVDLDQFAIERDGTEEMLDDLVCAAIREVVTTKSIGALQANSRKTTDNALLREVRELTKGYGVEFDEVRLTTFTTAKMICMMGDDSGAVYDDEEEEVE